MPEIAIVGIEEPARKIRAIYEKRGYKIVCFITDELQDMPDTIDGLSVKCLETMDENDLNFSELVVAVFPDETEEVREAIEACPYIDEKIKVTYIPEEEYKRLMVEMFPVRPETFLSTTEPVSRWFGLDRGTAIDRYYIEKFLYEESKKLTGAKLVLEVEDDKYSKAYFPRAEHDILDFLEGMDLTKPETLPQDKYDVFICTQTFHHIFDVKQAVYGAWSLLKPGGVMLSSVCGCATKIYRDPEYDHYWGFTDTGYERLLREQFGEGVRVKGYGNVMAATAFIQGVSLEEIDASLLDKNDSDFAVCICAAAQKKL